MVRRIAVACFVFAAALAVPASAEAAEWLTIDGVKHEAGVPAAAENGTSWKWDGKMVRTPWNLTATTVGLFLLVASLRLHA